VAQISDADAVPSFGDFDQWIIAADCFLADAIVKRCNSDLHIGGIRKSVDKLQTFFGGHERLL
jgi:hypothetical protein